MADPRVAVVMITHNRRDEVDLALGRLERLPEQPRVVLVDNGSTDGTAAMVRARHAGDLPGHAGVNLGRWAHLGRGPDDAPYVAFCDDDTWWSRGRWRGRPTCWTGTRGWPWSRRASGSSPGTGRTRSARRCGSRHCPRRPACPATRCLSFLAGASAVRRAAFEAAGGFSSRLWLGGEEELLASDLARDGWQMAYLPELRIHHQPSVGREPHLRRRHGIRNTLWFTWLRRPAGRALVRTVRLASSVPRDRVSLAGFLDAARGIPWVVVERRVVPPEVEAGYRLLEESQRQSRARRYVS